MTDLIKHLRRVPYDGVGFENWPSTESLMREAADEIERLRAMLTEPEWNVAVSKIADYRRSQNIDVVSADLIDWEFLNRRVREVNFGKLYTTRIQNLTYCRFHDGGGFDYVELSTIRDLVRMTEVEVMRSPNVGRATLTRIKSVLAEHGLHLGMEL